MDGSRTALESTTNIPPIEVATGDGAFSVGLHLPGVQCGVFSEGEGRYEVLLYHVATESAATVQVSPHATVDEVYPVRQHGSRQLWREAERAYRWWVEHGKPARTRYGLTVTPTGPELWLDGPSSAIFTAAWRH